MTAITRRALAAGLVAAALGTGVTPALAQATTTTTTATTPTTRTRLATEIAGLRGAISERVNPMNYEKNRPLLLSNIPRFRKFAGEVEAIPADAAQRTAKSQWISGVMLETVGNRQIANGLEAKHEHDAAMYRSWVVKGRDTLLRANRIVREAETSLGLRASSPAYFVYCRLSTCPAG